MSRYFAFFALLALAAAYPASDDVPHPITTITDAEFDDPSPWFRFSPFGNIFAPLTKLFSSFADIGPRIEIDDDKFRVIVNVKEYKKEDLKVKVKGDFILVQGAHEAKHDDHDLFASQFFHTYTLPINASAADVTAILTSDGYLDVTAPINGADEKYEGKEREVPIVESGKPLKDDKRPIAPAVVPVEPAESVEPVEPVGPVEPVEPVAPVAPVEPVEPVAPVATDAPVSPVAPVENGDKVEDFDKVENFDKVEPLDGSVEPLAKVESIEPTATVDKAEIEPTATVEKVENVEQPAPVTTELPAEVEVKQKVPTTTPASDREEVTVPIEDIKVPQDNEVNEIQP